MPNDKDFKVKKGVKPTVYHEKLGTVVLGSGTATLDLSTGSVFQLAPTSNIQLSLSNPAASGTVSGATLLLQGIEPSGIGSVFSTSLYRGTDAAVTITNGIDLAGEGGLVWVKARSEATSHCLQDTLRGTGFRLLSNTNDGNTSTTSHVTAFNNNGFTVGTSLSNGFSGGQTYVSWTFRQAPRFFDVVTYTGTGANRTIAHDLGVAPGCIFVKRTDTTGDWQVYHRSLANTEYMVLNSTAAKATGATRWNSTTPTSSVFSLGTDATVNASGGTYVAYLFAHDPLGLSGNGSDGKIACGSYPRLAGYQVELGWTPQWVLMKEITGTGNWVLLDSMRGLFASGNDAELYPNTTEVESVANNRIDINATGFSVVGGTGSTTWVYMAIRGASVPTITYDSSIDFPGNIAPTSPAFGQTDVLVFSTRDGGANYNAALAIDGAS